MESWASEHCLANSASLIGQLSIPAHFRSTWESRVCEVNTHTCLGLVPSLQPTVKLEREKPKSVKKEKKPKWRRKRRNRSQRRKRRNRRKKWRKCRRKRRNRRKKWRKCRRKRRNRSQREEHEPGTSFVIVRPWEAISFAIVFKLV